MVDTSISTGTIVPDTRGPDPIVHARPNLGLHHGEVGAKLDPSITSDQDVGTDLRGHAVQPLVQDKDSTKTEVEWESQVGTDRDTATGQVSNTGDGTTESAPKKAFLREFKGHKTTPSQHDSENLPSITTKQTDKKTNYSRASSKLKKNVEGQSSRSVSALESAKPTAETKARELVGKAVGKVARSNHKSSSAKNSGTVVEVSRASAQYLPAPVAAPSEVQLLTNPSDWPILPEKPIWPSSFPKLTIPAPQPLVEPPISTLLQEKPSLVEKPTSVGQPTAPTTVSPSGSIMEACQPQPLELTEKSSKPTNSDCPSDNGRQLTSEEMARDSSVSTQEDKGGALFESPSTAPTSFFQTERSSSIADELRLDLTELEEKSLSKERQSLGVDSDQLRSILQADFEADVTTPARHENFRDSSVQACSLTITDTTAPVESVLAQEPSHVEGASLQTPSVPNAPAILEPEGGKEHVKEFPQNVSNDGMKPVLTEEAPMMAANKMSGPPSIVPASPHGPSSSPGNGHSRSPERKHAPVIPPRSSSLPLDPAPIQTRHKKKPKKVVPVDKRGNTSTSKGPVAYPRQEENDQVLVCDSF